MNIPNAFVQSFITLTENAAKFLFNKDKEYSEENILRKIYIAKILIHSDNDDERMNVLEKMKGKCRATLSKEEYNNFKNGFLKKYKIIDDLTDIEKELPSYIKIINALDIELSGKGSYIQKIKKISKTKYSKELIRLNNIEKYIEYKDVLDMNKSLYDYSTNNEKKILGVLASKNKNYERERKHFSNQIESLKNRITDEKIKAIITSFNNLEINEKDIEKGELKFLSEIIKEIGKSNNKENRYGNYIKEIIKIGVSKMSQYKKDYIFNIMYSLTKLKLGVYDYRNCTLSFFEEVDESIFSNHIKNKSIVLNVLSYSKEKMEKDKLKKNEWEKIYKYISEKIPLEFYNQIANDETCLKILEGNK